MPPVKKRPSFRKRSFGNRVIFPRKRTSPLNELDRVPYKDVELIRNYLTERGRILPRRITGTDASTQRSLCEAIKRARNIALLSFTEGFTHE